MNKGVTSSEYMLCADCGKREGKVLCINDDKMRCWECWFKWREKNALKAKEVKTDG